MSLENLANLIWTSGMNLPDLALISEGVFEINVEEIQKEKNHGFEAADNLNFINL